MYKKRVWRKLPGFKQASTGPCKVSNENERKKPEEK